MEQRSKIVANPRIRDLRQAFALDDRDMQTMTRGVDQAFRSAEIALFRTEGASGGPVWQPLSPAYKKAKDRMFRGARALVRSIAKARGQRVNIAARLGAENKIMQRTGDLKRAMTQPTGDHVATYDLTARVIRVGARGRPARVGSYHHPDSPLKNPRLPARDVIQQSRQSLEAYSAVVASHLKAKLARVERVLSAFGALRRTA